ncbi:MAG: hybrid sensor histidine kinase/response regulator, partial [Gammaproteobacteria bacterium HGW-Gammaproteobacteria-14]
MTDRHDYLALDWVRGEIQETLNQAQQALEAYVDNPDDSTRMRFCQTYLHQVYGTLQMVEFYGAALLAEEMEKLAQALLDGRVSQLADAQETLMRAILQLPPYLDRVQASRRDLPLVLLPLLNDLRASRGESLLSETSLFKPDLAGAASHGDVPASVFDDPAFPQLVRKIRQMYQIALLGVIRGENLPANYAFLSKVFTKLKQVSGDAAMTPLWQVAAALTEGLAAGSVQLGTSIKSVLGHLDRLLRVIAKEGAPALTKAPPAELMKNLLYYIAKSDGDTSLIRKVRSDYRLEDSLPSDELVNAERAKMSGPDQAAMTSVVGALTEEINKVKDALESFVHNDEVDGSKLRPQSLVLKQVADTVAVLGLGQPRQLVEDQLVVIDAMAAGKQPVDRAALMDVAGALLYVEATLQGMIGERRSVVREGALSVVPDHVEKARDAVIRECRAGLEEAKDGIVEFIASQWQKEHLAGVPEKLTAVRGGLEMIQLPRPAAILSRCVSYIVEALLPEDSERPEWRSMDTLADAITSVEYYLERITDDPESGDGILDLARKSVGQLGYAIEDGDFGRGDEVAPAVVSAGVAGLASEEISLELPAVDISESTSVVEPEPTEEPFVEARVSVDEELSIEPEVESKVESVSAAPTSAFGDNDLIDDEIVEIFVEEASEVLEALNQYFPRWAANQGDEEALIEFRRAFHTLKGSGRMVGASTVGELAWSIENMMNRVIDKTIVAHPVLIELVREVHGLIPSLVQAFAERQADPCDVTPLSDAANTLAAGGSIDVVPAVRRGSVGEENTENLPVNESGASFSDGAASDETQEPEGEGPDEVLLDIFRTEADANVAMLEEWLNGIDPDLSENPLEDTVYRAFHTLKGSARMAGVTGVAELAEPAESYARSLAASGGVASRDAVSLIADVTAGLRQGLAESSTTDVAIPDLDSLLERLQQALDEGSASPGNDPHLIAAFLSAGMDLILDADSLLSRWSQHPTETAELKRLRDELGLLSSSADTAGLPEIAELSRMLERCYSALADERIKLTGDFLDIAMRAHEALLNMMDHLAAGQSLRRDAALIEALAAFLERDPEDDGPGGMDVEEIDISALSAPFDAESSALNWDDGLRDNAADLGSSGAENDALIDGLIESAAATDVSDETPLFTEVNDAGGVAEADDINSVDPELLEIFLEEAEEVLESAGQALDAWQAGDPTQLGGLQRDLHTLKGGARMAGIRAIGDLAHELETLYEGFGAGQLSESEELFSLLHRCHDRLSDMVDSVRAGQSCLHAPELINVIVEFLGGESGVPVTESLPDSAQENVTTAALPIVDEADASTISDHASADLSEPQVDLPTEPVVLEEDVAPPSQAERDPELVEIFLEEADEILEAVGTSLESWMEAPDNLIEVQSLQRDLHTLKGGARMAEIPELGDLGHELENLYEGLAMGSLKASPVLFELLHRCHDRLAEMVEGVKASRVLATGDDLIECIHGFIANPSGFVLPPLAATPKPPQATSPAPKPEVVADVVADVGAPVVSAHGAAANGFVLPADVDADILDIFVEESGELCEALESHLTAWQQEPENAAHGNELKRVLHTLKGGARLANLKELGDISHDFETALDEIDMRKAPEGAFFERMHGWQDLINTLVERLTSAVKSAADKSVATSVAPV